MNRRATHSRPTSGSLWFFSPPRQTAAGKMLQPPHQWHHLQKDLEAFTPIPPTDPPPTCFLLIPTFLDPPQLSLPKLIPWPPFFGTGWETAQSGSGDDVFTITDKTVHFSYLDHRGTISSLRRGLIFTPHSLYSFHLMSMLPLCISLYSIYSHSRLTAAYWPTSCKLRCFHTTSIRNNNIANKI